MNYEKPIPSIKNVVYLLPQVASVGVLFRDGGSRCQDSQRIMGCSNRRGVLVG